MISRRSLLAGMAALGAFAAPASAFEIKPYDAKAADKAIASGRPVILHVYAPWCLQCHAQAAILDQIKSDSAYAGLTVFRVDYDNQNDVVARLKCPRSTVIAYRHGKEVKRMSWGVTEASVVEVMKAAL
jgi:thioredoxin 1